MRKLLMLSTFLAAFCYSTSFAAAVPFYTIALDSAKNQLNRLTTSMGTNYTQFPRTATSGGAVTSVGYGDWCSGFFPGSLWLMYKYTQDAQWKTRARSWTDNLANAATVNDHDVGFRIMCSYGTGLEFQTAAQMKLDTAVMKRAARTLIGRYNATVKAIKSWDSYQTYTYPVIIDNMMNLELLTWATAASKDSNFQKIAVTHANTTIKNHFRANYSSYHLVAYDQTNGSVIRKMTVQGYNDASSWARGQAWGLYGYTMMYRETHDTAYLSQATHIADYIIPRLPTDLVPYWDFDVPLTPTPSRDASAAAIYASALVELSTFTTGATSQNYYSKAKAILQSLGSSTYTAAPNTNGNFILKHCTGNHPAGTEIDVPLCYADYYYLEALLRVKTIEDAVTRASGARGNNLTEKSAGLRLEPVSGGMVRLRTGTASQSPLTIRVGDIRGRTVMTMVSQKSGATVDLSGLPNGCYAIQATGNDQTFGAVRYVKQ
jgi:unsaturated chondroitin disaccharide hydrolase